jgi:hypothetical protein
VQIGNAASRRIQPPSRLGEHPHRRPSDDPVLREFPFLGSLRNKQKSENCGCGGKAKDAAAGFASARRVIAGLASDKKLRLKDILNAEKVRVRYSEGGRQIEKTF